MKIIISKNTIEAVNKEMIQIISDIAGEGSVDAVLLDALYGESSVDTTITQFQAQGLKNVKMWQQTGKGGCIDVVIEYDDEIIFAVMRVYRAIAPLINPIIKGFRVLIPVLKAEVRDLERVVIRKA
jgi:hypothetical protein